MNEININNIADNLRPVLGLGFVSFVVAMMLTPVFTTLAFRFAWWKKPRSDSTSGEKAKIYQKMHAEKHRRQIPTMAGVIFVLSVSLVTLFGNLDRGQTWLPLAALVGAGLIGLIDDIINLRGNGAGTAGLNLRMKLGLTLFIAAGLSYWFVFKLDYHQLYLPFVGGLAVGSVLLFALFIFIITATANAVNITDGLDGLAGGLSITSFLAFAMIAFLQGNYGIAGFCLTMVGALLSFIWFNVFPARFFMGDVGSFAIGTSLAVVAIMLNSTLLIPIIGGLFVLEIVSSFSQLIAKGFFKRKIFISAPLHHHLEAKGWPESKVTMRAWILSQVLAVGGLLVAVLGGLIK